MRIDMDLADLVPSSNGNLIFVIDVGRKPGAILVPPSNGRTE